MSLLRPSPGQCHDRLSILDLKIEAYKLKGKPIQALETESVNIRAYLLRGAYLAPYREADFARELPLEERVIDHERIGRLLNLLATVNRELWLAEDEVRILSKEQVYALANLAKVIPTLNDRRMTVIREIDSAYGCAEPAEEKVYRQGV